MSDLDDLMWSDPLSLSDQDIDKIILAHRKHRQLVEGGVKVKKPAAPLSGTISNLLKLMGEAPKPTTEVVTRR